MPYLLSSLLNVPESHINHAQHPTNLEAAEEILEEVASSALPVPTSSPSLIQACALTAGTLLIVGILGRLQSSSSHTSLDRRKSHSVSGRNTPAKVEVLLSWTNIKRMLLRMVTIGLPFLATVEIGGVRTGMILLGAAASGLLGADGNTGDQVPMKTWKRAITTRTWTCAVFFLCILCDLLWLRTEAEPTSLIRGYVALGKSILFLQPPLPTRITLPSRNTISRMSSFTSSNSAPSTPWSASPAISRNQRQRIVSSLVQSPREANLTIIAGAILGFVTALLSIVLAVGSTLTYNTVAISLASMVSAAAIFFVSRPSSLCTPLKGGYGFGIVICALYGYWFDSCTPSAAVALCGVTCLSYAAIQLDTRALNDPDAPDAHNHSALHHNHVSGSHFTRFLLHRFENWPLIHNILIEKESRRIVYFMCINLLFMFVQTFYALASGSLGLLSDSIHMFFDCVGLLAGLVAAVMSKWPPNSRFPYGYGKVETLSGLGNGIFLMIISVEIIWESMERFMEGAELRRITELLLVSMGGLAVNLIGLKFIGHHHHGHSHEGHSHSHDHSNGHATHSHDHNHSHSQQIDGDDHDHLPKAPDILPVASHCHSHSNENMAGIYLHILADTMGSVAVIISAMLIHYTGWSGWDPIASFIIAVLIILASYPLVVGSARKLLLTMPSEIEYALRSTLQELSGLRGVIGYSVPKFWLNDSDVHVEDTHAGCDHHHGHEHKHDHGHDSHEKHSHTHNHNHPQEKHSHSHDHNYSHTHSPAPMPKPACNILGVIHVIAAPTADLEDVRARVDAFLRERSMDVLVHVEREETPSSRGQQCWCGGIGGGQMRSGSVSEANGNVNGNGSGGLFDQGSVQVMPGAGIGKRGSIIAM